MGFYASDICGEFSESSGTLRGECSMIWIKRLLLLIAICLALVIGVSLAGIYMYRGRPSWYRPRVVTPVEEKAAANRADQKLIDILSWAAAARAQALRLKKGVVDPNEPPVGPKTVSFDEDEINSFGSLWGDKNGSNWQQRMSRYFTNGRLVFEDGSIIIAGDSPDFGTLVSANFTPSINDSHQLDIPLSGIQAGLLPIPQAALGGKMGAIENILENRLSEYQARAQINPSDSANGAAVSALYIRMLLNALNGTPADSVLLIPFDLNDLHHALPVKVTAIKAEQGKITVTLEPLPEGEDGELLKRLKAPFEQATAASE
jgi:hypothetical protein